ncbi:response regulator transcription factor, partial [Rhizobium leucaenae]|uniref:response regulator transcription factor n=1 Tax=Rhizobium leucaenae TaxID=29450 RepID=UPI0016127E79
MYSLTSTTHDRCSKPSVLEANKPVVFIIDDDVSVRESLEQLIRSAGWAPVIFDSARQFLECASTRGPSCLILDVNMPGVSGLELQRTIVAEGISVPIIFITGFGDVPMTVRAMKAGAVADSDVKPAANPIKDRPPFRFEAGHRSDQRPA